jgi:hypothetical protein
LHGDHFDATFAGHMSDGARFPDGTTHGPASMSFERHTATVMTGRHSGSDDAGAFNMTPSPTWDRPVALSFDSLLDADAMRDWMATMHPLEHGGHSHGGPMTGGGHHMGQNTVPSGQRNLFMFALVSGHGAIVDALAR